MKEKLVKPIEINFPSLIVTEVIQEVSFKLSNSQLKLKRVVP